MRMNINRSPDCRGWEIKIQDSAIWWAVQESNGYSSTAGKVFQSKFGQDYKKEKKSCSKN